MTMMFIRSILLLALVPSGSAQFKCSFSGSTDVTDCIEITDGDNHCVWCSIDTTTKATTTPTLMDKYGFCVSEVQAEAMEKSLPKLSCDRYTGTDDGVAPNTDDSPSTDDVAPTTDDTNPEPSTDDATPATDDANPEPSTDDGVEPTTDDTNPAPSTDDDVSPPDNNDDHSVPDDFWTCLQEKTLSTCEHANCTWCDTKGGFGLCMTGPTAESASHSAWFKCHGTPTTEELPQRVHIEAIDMTCVASFYEHPTANECMTTIDGKGIPCHWCTIMDMATVCLSSDQVEMGEALGLSCENDETVIIVLELPQDPYDPSCLLAFLEDSTESTCTATVDTDGTACEYCTLQGQFNVCLTSEQAAMGEQFGVTCESDNAAIKAKDDPYDTSCLLAYLQDSTKEGCVVAVDEDGTQCEFCTLQDVFNVCLTTEQAAMGEQLGITCDSKSSLNNDATAAIVKDDPYDPSCLLAYLQDQSKDTCVSAVDEDNKPCEFCNLQGAFTMCLTTEQAEMGEQLGITCDDIVVEKEEPLLDPYDNSCLVAFWSDQSAQSCSTAIDAVGKKCEYCSLPGSFAICLTSDQAKIGESVGMDCNSGSSSSNVKVNDPLDVTCALSYLQSPTKDACVATVDSDGSACTLCHLQDSKYFMCLSQDQANIGQKIGFSCDSDSIASNDIYDPVCLEAGMPTNAGDDTAAVCAAANGTDGIPCVWCDAAGVFGLCLSSEQAAAAGQYLQCDANVVSISM